MMMAKIIAPAVFAFLLTPLPKRLGLYEYLFSFHPMLVGLYPWSVSSEARAAMFRELYGNNDNSGGRGGGVRLGGQAAVVTGASSGIGYEISLALARLGANVTLACRDPARCDDAARSIREDGTVRGRVTTMTVDTSSLRSVRAFCEEYSARSKDSPLDMLFLNAAIKHAGASGDGSLPLSEDGIEMTFATNVVGHHLMYKLLEPSMSGPGRRTPARVVLTSSAVSYLVGRPYGVPTDLGTLNGLPARDPDLYHQSKLAQVLWARELAARDSAVYVNAANPGAVATKIWHDGAGGVGASFWNRVANFHRSLMWTPEEGALTPLYLGTAVEDLRRDDVRGRYFHPQATLMEDHVLFADDNARQTKILQRDLWKFLDELVAGFL